MIITPVFFSAFSPQIHQRQLQVSLLRHPGEARLAAQPAAGGHAVHGHEAAACPPEAEVSAPFTLFAAFPFPILSLSRHACLGSAFFFFPFTRNDLTFSPLIKITVKMTFSPSHFLSILPVISRPLPSFTFCLFPSRSRFLFGLAARNSRPLALPPLPRLEHMILFSCGCGNIGSCSSVLFFHLSL